jgi:hypothetical protein
LEAEGRALADGFGPEVPERPGRLRHALCAGVAGFGPAAADRKESSMTRRPLAQVRILKQPHLAPDAVRVEIDCRYSTTGLTSIPSEALRLTVPMLVTQACYEHEARCGECDVSEAHAQGDQQVRVETERAWNIVQAKMAERYVHEVRN